MGFRERELLNSETNKRLDGFEAKFIQNLKLKAIIVDDEVGARKVIRTLLTDFFPSIDIMSECSNLPECVKAIQQHPPDVVFLDIEMPGYSGLELFDFLNENQINFEVIFTTAYQEFAIDAFRLAAIDYLLKPIQFEQLKQAIERVEINYQNKTAQKQLEIIQKHLADPSFQEICISTTEGKYYVSFNDILYLEADGSYTIFQLLNGKKITCSRRLKHYEETLSKDNRFMRIHRSFLINKNHTIRLKRGEDAHVLMVNEVKLPVSLDRLKELEL